jgi:hypothetical protein
VQVAWWLSKRTFYLEWDDTAFLQVNCMSKDNNTTDSASVQSDCSQSVSTSMSSKPTNGNCEGSSVVQAIHTIGEDSCGSESKFSTFSSGIESLNSGHAGRVWTDEIFRATRKPWTF